MTAAPDPAALAHLAPALGRLYRDYDYAARLDKDPLGIVRRYTDPADLEIVGLIASALAYGRVDLFRPKIELILAWMHAEAQGPAAFVATFDPDTHRRFLGDFRYRVTAGQDLGRLLTGLRAALDTHGSLEAAVAHGFEYEHSDVGPALTRFVHEVYAAGPEPGRSLRHLLPSPARGSATKRLNLWMRWMVRKQAGVDLGIWTSIPPSHLILPLDTHSLRMAYNLGLTHSKAMTWRNAQRVTSALATMDPTDPVKYDFALCHLGMSGDCPAQRQPAICGACGLKGLCRWW